MKKLMTGIVLATSAALVVGCTGTAPGSPSGSGSPSTAPDCGYAQVYSEPVGTTLFSRQVSEGIQRAKDELGVEVATAEPTDSAGIADALRTFAARGCHKLILTQGFQATDALQTVAQEYPDQSFAILDSTIDQPNISSVTWATHEVSYLLGYAAANMTKTGQVGVLLGMDLPPLWRFRDGFSQGAKDADPNVQVSVDVVGAFNDPAKGRTLAVGMKARGIDIIYPLTGSNEAIVQGANESGYSLISVNRAEAGDQGKSVAYMIDDVNTADSVYFMIERKETGTLNPGAVVLGLKDGVFQVAPINSEVEGFQTRMPAELVQKLKSLEADIVSGKTTAKDPLAP